MVNIVEITNLTKSFGEDEALRGINLDIKKDEVFGLIGPDGAGKSTLLRIIAGIISPTKGSVKIFGKDILEEEESIKRNIGYLPQGVNLYDYLTVSELLRFFLSIYGVQEKGNEEWISFLLEITKLKSFRHHRSGSLSGGMKQKLALACAVIHKPGLLLLDEPTTGLDPVSRMDIWGFLNELHREGITFIISTSYMEEADKFSRIGFFHRGRLIASGSLSDLKSRMAGKLFVMRCRRPGKIGQKLRSLDFVKGVRLSGDSIYIWVETKDDGDRIAEYVRGEGYDDFLITSSEFSVSDLFNFFKKEGSLSER